MKTNVQQPSRQAYLQAITISFSFSFLFFFPGQMANVAIAKLKKKTKGL